MTNHSIEWDNTDKTVVLQQYKRGATKMDLYKLAEKSSDMLNSVSHTVHLIIDESRIRLMLSSRDIKHLEKQTPSNQGAVMLVFPKEHEKYKQLIRDMAETVAPHAFGQSYFFETIEDARAYLEEHYDVVYEDTDKS